MGELVGASNASWGRRCDGDDRDDRDCQLDAADGAPIEWC